jgi:hypothetical protein
MKYTNEDIKEWAEKYKEYKSIKKTALYFGVDCGTVRKYFKDHKKLLNIVLPRDLDIINNGQRLCSSCKIYKAENLDNFYMNGMRFSSKCKECTKLKSKKYVKENYEQVMARNSKYYKTHIDLCRKIKRRWKKNHPEYVKKENLIRAEKQKIWRQNNRERTNLLRKHKRAVDTNYKISCYLRSRVSTAIRNNYKTGSAIGDLGCSIEELKRYLETKFYVNTETGEQMTWENYGEWHIDHIRPLSSFDLSISEQFKIACHYTNLQPMWAKDNIAKGGTNRRNYVF